MDEEVQSGYFSHDAISPGIHNAYEIRDTTFLPSKLSNFPLVQTGAAILTMGCPGK